MNMIAENIARRRKELGMTQKELAERLNISDKTLSRWETDKQVPDALMIPEIARALDMSIAEIYGIADAADKMKNNQSHEQPPQAWAYFGLCFRYSCAGCRSWHITADRQRRRWLPAFPIWHFPGRCLR